MHKDVHKTILISAIVIAAIIGGFIFYTIQVQSPQKPTKLEKVKEIIKTEVRGLIVYYYKESFWNKDSFLRILEEKDEFSSNITNEFISTLSTYGLKVMDTKVEFNVSNSSTILKCKIYGAVSETKDGYYARFGWLIRPLGLDFIDNHFNESEYGLSWNGVINGVPTEIVCRFPYTGSPYKAWAHPTGHCHAHVWWKP